MGKYKIFKAPSLFNKVRKILFQEWNPIGFPDLPRDEYDSYIPEIVKKLSEGCEETALAEHLRDTWVYYFYAPSVPTEEEMNVIKQRSSQTAAKLIQLKGSE